MENFISEDLKLAVKRGINWLDENHSGWEYRIDLSKLNMVKCTNCIIGQAVGNYYDVLQGIGNWDQSQNWAEAHGFQAPFVSEHGDDYRGLETLWSNEVRDRLGINSKSSLV